MGQLEDMQVFIRVAEAGGISRAAEQLGIAKSAVSRRLSELEQRLGIRLLSRTTRTASLTEAGRRYYACALQAVDYVTEINAELAEADAALSGTLRIASPLTFGIMHLSPILDVFAKQHPQLEMQIDFSDRQVDLVEEGFDMAIRIAELKDSNVQARKLCPVRRLLVASPAYLADRGTPHTPSELKAHDTLKYGGSQSNQWRVTDADGKEHQLHLKSKMIANNGDFLKDMAIAGHGIVVLPSFIVWQALAAGELVQVLPDCSLPATNAYAVYPQNRFLPQRARLLIDYLVKQFGDAPYWDQALVAVEPVRSPAGG